jgi:hypothetical protein
MVPSVGADAPSNGSGETIASTGTTSPDNTFTALSPFRSAVGPAQASEGAPLSYTGSENGTQIVVALILVAIGTLLLAWPGSVRLAPNETFLATQFVA